MHYKGNTARTFCASFSSAILAVNMSDSELRDAELKISVIKGLCSDTTRKHVAIRSTSSSVIGWKSEKYSRLYLLSKVVNG